MAWKPAYCTAAELRAYMGMPVYPGSPTAPEVNEQTSITLACESASRAVDRSCGRQFGLLGAATERLYTAKLNTWVAEYQVDIDDLMTTTGLIIDSDGTTVTDYTLLPLNAAGDGMPWTMVQFAGSVTTTLGALGITAKFGWTAVPDTIKNATLLQAERFFKRKDSPFGIAGSPDMGNELRLLAKVDVDVAVMIADYRRIWGAR